MAIVNMVRRCCRASFASARVRKPIPSTQFAQLARSYNSGDSVMSQTTMQGREEDKSRINHRVTEGTEEDQAYRANEICFPFSSSVFLCASVTLWLILLLLSVHLRHPRDHSTNRSFPHGNRNWSLASAFRWASSLPSVWQWACGRAVWAKAFQGLSIAGRANQVPHSRRNFRTFLAGAALKPPETAQAPEARARFLLHARTASSGVVIVDFLMEDIQGASDEQIGQAVREIRQEAHGRTEAARGDRAGARRQRR